MRPDPYHSISFQTTDSVVIFINIIISRCFFKDMEQHIKFNTVISLEKRLRIIRNCFTIIYSPPETLNSAGEYTVCLKSFQYR